MSDAALLERVEAIEQTQLRLIEDIERLLAVIPVPEYVGIPYVAARMNVSEQYLYDHPELQPRHGISNQPGKKAWLLAFARDWVATPAAEHAKNWEALPPAMRVAITRKRKAA